jgi:hypothetical protein
MVERTEKVREEIEKNQELEKKKSDLIITERLIKQKENELDFISKEYDIKKRILDYQNANLCVVDGKPKYFSDDEYFKIYQELENLYFEKYEKEYKDELTRAEMAIGKGRELVEQLKGEIDGKE